MAASSNGSSQQTQPECEGCGYDPSNKRHEESYWEGRTDPRGYEDSRMKFNGPYYKVIDRQIAEDHATRCIPQGQPSGQGYRGSNGQGYNRSSAQGYNNGPSGQEYYTGPRGQGYYNGPIGQGYNSNGSSGQGYNNGPSGQGYNNGPRGQGYRGSSGQGYRGSSRQVYNGHNGGAGGYY